MPNVVAIDSIIADSRCQSRTGIELALVQEYADAIAEGAEPPPLSTIRTDEGYYLYDGFHRLEAYRQAGKSHVVIEARPGDVWDAVEASCAVNNTHGKRRTPADVKNAVKKIIEVMHHRGVRWNQSEIAEKCGISQQRVSQIIGADASYKDLYDSAAPTTTVTRNGMTYEMDTSRIGKRRAEPEVFVMDDGPAVDEDTGEILDDDPEIEPEYVSTADHQSFLPDPPPVSSPKPSPKSTSAATASMPSPQEINRQNESEAEAIRRHLLSKYSASRAMEILDLVADLIQPD